MYTRLFDTQLPENGITQIFVTMPTMYCHLTTLPLYSTTTMGTTTTQLDHWILYRLFMPFASVQTHMCYLPGVKPSMTPQFNHWLLYRSVLYFASAQDHHVELLVGFSSQAWATSGCDADVRGVVLGCRYLRPRVSHQHHA